MPINLNFKSNKRNEPLKTTWLFWSEKQGIIGYQHSHLSGVSNFCSLGCLQFFIPYIGGQVEDVHQWVMSNHIREFDTPLYPKILSLKFINFFFIRYLTFLLLFNIRLHLTLILQETKVANSRKSISPWEDDLLVVNRISKNTMRRLGFKWWKWTKKKSHIKMKVITKQGRN